MLRDIADAREIARRMETAQKIVVIGGGFIGLEVAATARKKNINVIVIEALDRLMARAVTPAISHFFAELHLAHGVDLMFSAQVMALEGRIDGAGFERGRISKGQDSKGQGAVGTAHRSGAKIPADLVIFGIGALANDELAVGGGVEVSRGVLVDACGRTSDKNIVAAGDCTAFAAMTARSCGWKAYNMLWKWARRRRRR